MTVLLTINGQSFNYPSDGDENWGPDATDWATAVTSGMLQKAGGLFTLLDEVDFGATYGLKSTYFKSRSSNIAAAGAMRLARADTVSWRNQANSADLPLGVNSSDVLTFNGNPIQGSLSVTDTATINLTFAADTLSADIVNDSITNAMINSAAAITYSKLNLTGSIINADINASAAIAYSKLATLTSGNILVGSVGNVATSITMSGDATIIASGALTIANGAITNAKVNASAAIAVNKLAALTASRAVVTDGSGFISAATTTATEIGYVNGVTSSIQTQLDAKTTNPLTTTGDMVYASNTATPATASRLGIGATSTVLQVTAGLPSWGLLVNANIDAAAAIAGTKVSPNFGSQNVTTTGSITGTSFQGSANANAVYIGSGTAALIASQPRSGTNLTGVNTVLQAGLGTGTGTSGDILFQVGFAGSSGTTVNSATNVGSIEETGQWVIGQSGGTLTHSIQGQVSVTGGQIVFPATQNPSSNANTLDDYEEGTFTPVMTGAGGGAATYTQQIGAYVKIGRFVYTKIHLIFNVNTLSGNCTITGLPFTAENVTSSFVAIDFSYWSGLNTSIVYPGGYVAPNTTVMTINRTIAAAANINSSFAAGDFSATTDLILRVSYTATA